MRLIDTEREFLACSVGQIFKNWIISHKTIGLWFTFKNQKTEIPAEQASICTLEYSVIHRNPHLIPLSYT